MSSSASSATAASAAPIIKHDEAGSIFTAPVKGFSVLASLEYVRSAHVLDITHTFVPPEARGQGLAKHLANAAFAYARAQKLSVRPSCSYISGSYLVKREGTDAESFVQQPSGDWAPPSP